MFIYVSISTYIYFGSYSYLFYNRILWCAVALSRARTLAPFALSVSIGASRSLPPPSYFASCCRAIVCARLQLDHAPLVSNSLEGCKTSDLADNLLHGLDYRQNTSCTR